MSDQFGHGGVSVVHSGVSEPPDLSQKPALQSELFSQPPGGTQTRPSKREQHGSKYGPQKDPLGQSASVLQSAKRQVRTWMP